MFEIHERDGLARIGTVETPHGTMETPCLLPVVNPNKPLIRPAEMAALFKASAVITNSYILWRTPALREKALEQGVHALLEFQGPVMTDSGTFQSYVYGDVEVSAPEILNFQREIGSDIGTILDLFTEPDADRSELLWAIDETVVRGAAACDRKGEMLLAGTVQGGVSLDLRTECARRLSSLNFDLHPIGGVVPLMEGYRFAEMVDVILASKMGLNPARPVHLFGAGHPMIFPIAVLLGCDLFDSSSYAKYAADGRILTSTGTLRVAETKEMPCWCPVCSTYTPTEIASSERLMAEHNLHVSIGEMRRVREALRGGYLWEMVEERARAHPALLEALRRLRIHVQYMEGFEPLSRRGAIFYTGPETRYRPAVQRFLGRLRMRTSQHQDKRPLVILPESQKPYGRHYAALVERLRSIADVQVAVECYFSLVPIELDEVYPIAQSIIPKELDEESVAAIQREMKALARSSTYKAAIFWDGAKSLEVLRMIGASPASIDRGLAKVRAVADYQFGPGAGAALTDGEVRIVRSKRTGMIRNVYLNGGHVLSMRAHDGFFTLKSEGARVLHRRFQPPRLRTTASNEAAPFVREGKSLFARFALGCDPELRPGDETLIVDEEDRLIGVGRLIPAPVEIGALSRGVAVKVRAGIA
ncbi:MAG: tRNA guanosine(15) transglycosylase TgtA [Candidatus Thermoplasmatota archaeon]